MSWVAGRSAGQARTSQSQTQTHRPQRRRQRLFGARAPGRAADFPEQNGELGVRRVLLSAGAGYLVPLVGNIVRMPGLPVEPQAFRMDLVDGKIEGLLGG